MDNIIEIKEGDFVKYRKDVYLVKSFDKLDDRDHRLSYYFRSQNKDNAKLYPAGFSDKSTLYFSHIKKASPKEIQLLISKIKREKPDFELQEPYNEEQGIKAGLTEDNCIEYLKSKGYLVYKQV